MVLGTSCNRPSILGFLGYSDIGVIAQMVPGTSWDTHAQGLCTGNPRNILSILGSSEYPGNPGILRQWGNCTNGSRNILGSSEYPGNPGIHVLRVPAQVILGTSWDRPSILGILGYSDRGVGRPRNILGSSEYPVNPGILRQWGNCTDAWSQEHPGIVWYPRNPGILRKKSRWS